MKKLLAATFVAAVTTSAAVAADLPSRKAPVDFVPPPPVFSWSGFYIGLNAGGTFGGSKATTVASGPAAFVGPFPADAPVLGYYSAVTSGVTSGGNRDGFIGGGQIGWNYQVSPSIVAGLEADISGVAGANGAGAFASTIILPPPFVTDPINGAVATRAKLSYLGTVRARIGYLFTPTFLVYATGGLAYGGTSLSGANFTYDSLQIARPMIGGASRSNTQVGYSVGGGVEWMFAPNWSVKAEYLYYDLGRSTTYWTSASNYTFGAPFGMIATAASTRFNGHIARAGINYHFNWGSVAPVVARY